MDMLRVVLLKPSKYLPNGFVERFRRGFMPNASLSYLRSLTPARVLDHEVEVHLVDEYVERDLAYLELLHRADGYRTVVALVGTQTHQFHRALDLAAYARSHGVSCSVIGGPHPMTCDTTALQGRGVSFALAEAELIWQSILEDTIGGELRLSYGSDQRWQQTLDGAALTPPSRQALGRYIIPMLGLYPARGVPTAAVSARSSRSPATGSGASRSSTPWRAFAGQRRPACGSSCSPRTTSTSTQTRRACSKP